MCLSNLQTGACRDISGVLTGQGEQDVPGCSNITTGLVAIDGGCDRNFECVDGSYCDGAFCRALPGLDQQCPDGMCAAGLYCRGFNMGQRCVPKEIDGRLCDGSNECASGYCTADPRYMQPVCGAPNTCVGRTR
jgi:hypothetical protein